MNQKPQGNSKLIMDWLLNAEEPWTRYRTYVDLLHMPADDPDTARVRAEMIAHPLIQTLITKAVSWPGYALKRHNDANHPLYALSTMADFGLRYNDPGVRPAVEKVLAHQSADGAFQTKVRLYKRFGGLDEEIWTWMACDAPTLAYALMALGMEKDSRVQQGAEHLLQQVQENGWRCTVAPELGNFHGPGHVEGPCPIANVYALKVLSLRPEWIHSEAAHRGTEMLLWHWENQKEQKVYLFGIGSDYRKLKYPFVWYDILHVADVLSRFPFVHDDPRFREIVETITQQADDDGRYTATSMYRAWQDWSFADKKRPSSWLTFLVMRIQKRMTDN